VRLDQKEQKRLYLEARQAKVEAMNSDLQAEVEELETLLQATLEIDDYLDFESLKVEPEIPPFQPGGLDAPEVAPSREIFMTNYWAAAIRSWADRANFFRRASQPRHFQGVAKSAADLLA
jgi:hypothetical protein